MRDRIEDLGRLYELLKQALQAESLIQSSPHADIHTKEFFKQSPDDQYAQIHNIFSDLYEIKELVYESLLITSGEDELNLTDGMQK